MVSRTVQTTQMSGFVVGFEYYYYYLIIIILVLYIILILIISF